MRPGTEAATVAAPPAAEERLQLRVSGEAALPTLIYLPGLHGDWTLVGSFRRALGSRVRFIEITYPRTLTWSLDDYAAAVENALARAGVNGGWLLGESFGSQVVWSLLGRRKFNIQGIILAGGFVRHPMRALARLGAAIAGGLPLSVLTWILFSYAKLARYRYRHAPETLADLREFVARRTVLDFQAAKHRLRLVAANDPRAIVVEVLGVPIYGLSGMLDPIVPWFRVRPWLRTHCRALRAYRVIPAADHNVLGTAPDAAAEQVLKWLDA